jgi:hypothetical protein
MLDIKLEHLIIETILTGAYKQGVKQKTRPDLVMHNNQDSAWYFNFLKQDILKTHSSEKTDYFQRCECK